MKHFYIFVLFTLCLLLPPGCLPASGFEVDGLNYELLPYTENEVEVVETPNGSPQYSGDITIPANVEYNGKKYSVTAIGENAFRTCTKLTSVKIPESVTSINRIAFEGCTGLTSINIPESVTSITYSAFKGCTGLTSIIIPESVIYIGASAFEGCTGLKSITIPKSVTYIQWSVFSGCTGLTSVTLPKNLTQIGKRAFEGCTGLKSINIPESVTSIGESAFETCTGLTSINIPEGVTYIGGSAFEDCTGLTSITIPESVTDIAFGIIDYCTGLSNIVIKTFVKIDAATSGFTQSQFDNTQVVVPHKMLDWYKRAEPWSKFKNLRSDDPSGIRLTTGAQAETNARAYDLGGRQLKDNARGLRIVDGKKIYRK